MTHEFKIGDLVLDPNNNKCKIVYILKDSDCGPYAMLVFINEKGSEDCIPGRFLTELKPYTEPKKQVMRWPALYISCKKYVVSDALFKDEEEAKKYWDDAFIRILKEWPGILCDE